MNGSEPAKHRLHPHTRARHGSWRACARVTRCKPREWHQRQERRALAAPRSCTECARSVCHGHRLRHCSRAARRRRSISRASKASAHCAYAAGTWQSMAAHRLWWLVCHRQCCQSLTCVLEPQQAAAASSSSSLLLPHSVKPAAQRGVQKSRGFVAPEAERIQAHRPELDGSTRITETRATSHVRRHGTGRCARPLVKTTRKTRI